MDTKVAILSGLLVTLLIGSGLLIVIDNTGDNQDKENGVVDEIIQDPIDTNQKPVVFVPDISKSWDGENTILSGFIYDESPTTCTISIKLINPLTNGENIVQEEIQISNEGKWVVESQMNQSGLWVVLVSVTDEDGLISEISYSELQVIEPKEADVKITFLWAPPLSDEEPNGTLTGFVIHEYLDTCNIVYQPLFQSPVLDVVGEIDFETGEFSMELNTSEVNTKGGIVSTCGLFTDSIVITNVDLPMPPEPVGDSDLDGILDDVDQCLETPQGEPVYLNGCSDSEVDDDEDGINNNRDICPNTPKGDLVDSQGCSSSQKDSDNDGITNDLDLCPFTPADEVVDSNGCSSSQLDSDNDGISDNLDQCPDTPSGESVDDVGCADSQKENPEPSTRPKILALHGGGETANGLRNQQGTQDLMNALPGFDFVFASTPESNNVWIKDPPGGKGEPTTDPDWADLSISYLDQMVEDNGPFYAILGYSQGAAMVPVYLANTDKTFDRALMYNGYLPTTHEGLIDTIDAVAPFDIPAMVFSGENDGSFKDLAPALANKFANSLDVHSNTAGHHLPYQSDSTFDTILDFILDGLQTFEKSDSWLCQNGQGPWVKDLNGEGNSYNSNTRGAGQSGGGGGSGPWFQCEVSVTVNSNNMQVTSNAIPNHNWLSAFAANADEQNMDWTIPLNPVEDTSGGHNSANCPAANGAYECAPDRGAVAVAVNGVPIFGPEEGPGGDAVALEFLYFDEDRQPIDLGYCGAHNGPGGVHYHFDAMCQFWDDPNGETIVNYDYTDLDPTTHSPIIGWAFDGYPIYGMYGWDSNGEVIPLT
ncbi:MAG: YHYH protein, partial [Candidatus Thermoplasmatota archaeon]|nr:YHYH protein [Candidatus Thermoplasmatota archaeon]